MNILNRLLQRQITKYFRTLGEAPLELLPLLKIVSETYDHHEKDRKMLERSIEISSAEMRELNNKLTQEIIEVKRTEEKLINANRLYSFISQINQTIVHVSDRQTLFNEACRIAITFGNYDMVWVGRLDEPNRIIQLVAQNNIPDLDTSLFSDVKYTEIDSIEKLLLYDNFYVITDYTQESESSSFLHQYAYSSGFKSSITLPVKELGKTQYIISFFSQKANNYDTTEITLLKEAVGDISFALEVFEKERQRKLFEDKIKHNELRLRQAQAIAHLGSWQLDFSTGIAEWSDEACRIYGLDPNDNAHSHQDWLSFIHPDDMEYVLKVTKEGQETLSNTAFHHRIIRKDGTIRHLFAQTQFEFNVQGQPIGLYGVVHDITDTREAESAFEQSETNMRQIIDLMPQSIFAKNYDGEFIFINKNFAALYGVEPKDLMNKSAWNIIPLNSDAEMYRKQDQEVILSGLAKPSHEYPFTDYKGNVHLFEIVKVPYIVAGTNEKAILGVINDITEQREAVLERTKIVADIVQRNKDLEQFTYIVSHNLRSPVANIIGLAELMQIIKPSGEEEKIMMGELYTSVKKLDNVIQDLNYVLQVKNQVNEKKELVTFSELCSDIQLSIDNLLKSEDVKVVCDFSAVDKMTTLKSYLYSIFFNLISNSIKYRQHGIQSVIEVSSREENNNIELTFKDNGLGIDLEENADKIFGLYKRFHSHAEGKGMGLYMVKTQVETLGGKISIESEINKGTIFKIFFENT